jgi:hypothetical protein
MPNSAWNDCRRGSVTDPVNQQCAVLYARVMARLRQSDAAFTRLAIGSQTGGKYSSDAVAQQVLKDGIRRSYR